MSVRISIPLSIMAGPVTLSVAKGLAAALGCHPERSEGSARGAQRCCAALSMTARTPLKVLSREVFSPCVLPTRRVLAHLWVRVSRHYS